LTYSLITQTNCSAAAVLQSASWWRLYRKR